MVEGNGRNEAIRCADIANESKTGTFMRLEMMWAFQLWLIHNMITVVTITLKTPFRG